MMARVKGLEEIDRTDRRIISLLMEKPDISQSEIASHLKLSQPAIYTRIRRMKNRGIITSLVGVNLKKTDLHIAKIEITAKDPWKIVEFFKECPICLNGLITSGKHNMCLFFVSEKLEAIDCCVNHHLRKNPNIIDVEFNVVVTPIKNLVVPLRMYHERQEKSPCGRICAKQPCYLAEKCLGCPATTFYKGKFL